MASFTASPAAAPRVSHTGPGRRGLHLALLLGGLVALGFLGGEQAQAADDAAAPTRTTAAARLISPRASAATVRSVLDGVGGVGVAREAFGVESARSGRPRAQASGVLVPPPGSPVAPDPARPRTHGLSAHPDVRDLPAFRTLRAVSAFPAPPLLAAPPRLRSPRVHSSPHPHVARAAHAVLPVLENLPVLGDLPGLAGPGAALPSDGPGRPGERMPAHGPVVPGTMTAGAVLTATTTAKAGAGAASAEAHRRGSDAGGGHALVPRSPAASGLAAASGPAAEPGSVASGPAAEPGSVASGPAAEPGPAAAPARYGPTVGAPGAPRGVLGGTTVFDGGAPRDADVQAVLPPQHRMPLWQACGPAPRCDAPGTRDSRPDVPVFPG
ncbi:hypothetical protein PYK79_47945 [Streptomyces sp. ID05-04B]|uniref:hypothetical protein n=1 Tax=unclassified Streptomyces TaxID=2593676 RepID=UPI000D199A88|nr:MULTISPECIES: hypothetical protein [unclassified Streptomyces]AVV40911.1 hypothetical protein C6376_05135 [Streptomyces sp. P3]MDX5569449.1 hypothetical protein [Streptomyces sp. ID05-04B]